MEKQTKSKGITLIALVITIIVLLILAAVSIATLTGENGLLTKATTAKERQKEAEVKEKVQMEVLASYDETGHFNMEMLKENLKSHLNVKEEEITDNEDGSITFPLDGYTVTVTEKENGKIEITLEGDESEVPDTEGPEVEITVGEVTDTSIEIKVTATDNSGKISSYEYFNGEKSEGNTPTETEHTFKNLTQETEYTLKVVVTDKSGNTGTNSVTQSTIRGKVQAGQKAENGIKNYESDGKIAVIPEGFTVSNVPGETSIDNGLVVKAPAPDESEFVWVPVPDYNKFKRTVGYKDDSLDTETFNKCGEADKDGNNEKETESQVTIDEAIKMYASIQKNKGFYIARYEAGEKEGKVVSKQGESPITDIRWSSSYEMNVDTGGAVEEARGMAKENGYTGVTSTLCYGVQWDAALNFIDPKYITNEKDGKPDCDTTSYVRNSAKQGWYDTSIHNTGVDIDGGKNKPKNIYDMAGNVFEWTMESWTPECRVYRGGSYDLSFSDNPASSRVCGSQPFSASSIGFRVTLFITAE